MAKLSSASCGAALAVIAAVLSSPAQADTFSLDYGNVAASGQQITITRLPVVRQNGKIEYKDVTVQFGLSKKRKLTILKGYPKTELSAATLSASLVAGRYQLNSTNYMFDLVGPGDGPNGRDLWTLIGVGNSADVTFYAGPVDGHPLQQRLNDAGITSSPFTFGESSTALPATSGFAHGCLVSANMVQGKLKLNSHSSVGNCTGDQANPFKTYSLLKCSNDTCS